MSFEVLEQGICNRNALSKTLSSFRPDVVIHCAGLKAVGDGNSHCRYYRSNVEGSISLLEAMDLAGCQASSSRRLLPFMARRIICPMMRRTRWRRSMSMDVPRRLSRASSPTGPRQMQVGYRDCCAISILSARMGPAKWREPAEHRNNLVPYIADVATGKRPGCQFLEMTMKPAMARGSIISS